MPLFATKGGFAAAFQKCLGVHLPKDVDQAGDEPDPSCLMTGPDASAIVAMEIFVE